MGTNEDWQKLMNKYRGKRLTRGRAIKLYCKLECCAGDLESWKNCPVTNCFLWRYRTGRESLAKPTSFKKGRKNPNFKPNKHTSEEVSNG